MIKVDKVMMFVWRDNNGQKEFFVVHREGGENVVPTGHIEQGETIEKATLREASEEFGIEPLETKVIDYKVVVELKKRNKISTEHAVLVQLPNVPVEFSERCESWGWYRLQQLNEILSYKTQKDVIKIVTE